MAFYGIVLWLWLVWANTALSELANDGDDGGVYRVDRRDLQLGSFGFRASSGTGYRRSANAAAAGTGVFQVDRRDFDRDQPFSNDDYFQARRYDRGGGRDQFTVVKQTSLEQTRSLPRLFVPAAGESSRTPSFDWRRNYDQMMPIAAYLGRGDGIGYELRTPRALLAAPTPRQTFDVIARPARPIVREVDDNTLAATAKNAAPAVVTADDESKPLPAITGYGKAKIDRRTRDEDDRRRPTIKKLPESGEESDLVETFLPETLVEAHGESDDHDSKRPIKRRRRLASIRSNIDKDFAKLVDGGPFGDLVPVMYERLVQVRSVEMRRSVLHEVEFDLSTDNFDDDGFGSWWPSVVQHVPNESKIQIENRRRPSDDDRFSISTVTQRIDDGPNVWSSTAGTAETSPSTDTTLLSENTTTESHL